MTNKIYCGIAEKYVTRLI